MSGKLKDATILLPKTSIPQKVALGALHKQVLTKNGESQTSPRASCVRIMEVAQRGSRNLRFKIPQRFSKAALMLRASASLGLVPAVHHFTSRGRAATSYLHGHLLP